nr:unnamed protein product [Naegleria fowleri]
MQDRQITSTSKRAVMNLFDQLFKAGGAGVMVRITNIPIKELRGYFIGNGKFKRLSEEEVAEANQSPEENVRYV